MRTLGSVGIILLSALYFSSCQKPSNAPIVPSISFKSFTAVNADSARLSINFADGDGDIGTADGSGQPDMWVRYLYYNWTGKKYEEVWNPNDSVTFDSVYFVYNLPNLTPKGRNKSLSGIIEVAISPSWYLPLYTQADSNLVKFQVWILDRAGHKSNVITTPVQTGL